MAGWRRLMVWPPQSSTHGEDRDSLVKAAVGHECLKGSNPCEYGRRASVGSRHLGDQFVLPFYAGAEVSSVGNTGPSLTRNHTGCVHDANIFIPSESYSRTFVIAYRTLLPLLGRRAIRTATATDRDAAAEPARGCRHGHAAPNRYRDEWWT
jgi:hypothetical protein